VEELEHYNSHSQININVPGKINSKSPSSRKAQPGVYEIVNPKKCAQPNPILESMQELLGSGPTSNKNNFTAAPVRNRPVKPRNLFNVDTDYFRKLDDDPSLFNVEIDREIYKHLNNNVLDPVSKNEVVYKVLKEQLRQQQARLIQMKEEKRLEKHRKMLKKKAKTSMTPANLKKFTDMITNF
jgi:hypothetical protein